MTLASVSVLLLVAKASALLAAAAVLATVWHNRAAARRHALWTGAFVGLLLLPVAALLTPSWYAGWLAQPTNTSEAPIDAATPPAGALPALPALPGLPGTPASPSTQTPLPLVPLIYGLGLFGVMGYGLLGAAQLRRWRQGSLPHAVLTAEASELAVALGIRRPVAVRIAPGVPTPMTWGVRRPLVLMPADATSWPAERRRVVFLHELAHVARYDALSQTVAFVGCAALWFHPLTWWGAHAMRTERERACDDLVLALGTRPSSYAAHLVALARTLRPRAVPAFAAAVVRQSELERRVRAILAPTQHRGRMARGRAAMAIAGAAAFTFALAAFQPWTRPQTASTPKPRRAAVPTPEPNVQEMTALRFRTSPGGTLTLDAEAGAVEVTPWARNEVVVETWSTFGGRFRTTGRTQGTGVRVEGRWAEGRAPRWQSSDRLRFVVRVPARYSVHLSTAGGSIAVAHLDGGVTVRTAGGSVAIDGATGPVQAATAGGSVTVGRVGGRLAVETSGGSIRLNGGAGGALSAQTAGGSITATIRHRLDAPVTLETSGGAVALTLPAGVNANLDAEAQGGRIASDFGPASSSRLRTTLGQGGPLVRLRSTGGSVAIRRSSSASISQPTDRIATSTRTAAASATLQLAAKPVHDAPMPIDDAWAEREADFPTVQLTPVDAPPLASVVPPVAMPQDVAPLPTTEAEATPWTPATRTSATGPSNTEEPMARVRVGTSLSADSTALPEPPAPATRPSSVLNDLVGQTL